MGTPTELAKVAYAAYGEATGGKNYQGLPMPEWDDLGDAIQYAWVESVRAVRDHLLTPPVGE